MCKRNYDTLLPALLNALFKSADDRIEAENILSRYKDNEQSRVKVGILRVSNGEPEAMRVMIDLANKDYRDLLVQAEFGLSFSQDRLRKSDPDAYRKLQDREIHEYEEWIEVTLAT